MKRSSARRYNSRASLTPFLFCSTRKSAIAKRSRASCLVLSGGSVGRIASHKSSKTSSSSVGTYMSLLTLTHRERRNRPGVHLEMCKNPHQCRQKRKLPIALQVWTTRQVYGASHNQTLCS